MPETIEITGQLGVGKRPNAETGEPEDILILNVSPFRQFIVPLPDDTPPGAPPDFKTARQLVKDYLNKGVILDPRQAPHPGPAANL